MISAALMQSLRAHKLDGVAARRGLDGVRTELMVRGWSERNISRLLNEAVPPHAAVPELAQSTRTEACAAAVDVAPPAQPPPELRASEQEAVPLHHAPMELAAAARGRPDLPAPTSADVARSRRKRETRASSIPTMAMAGRDLEAGRAEFPDEGQHDDRPRTRADCIGHVGPCPWLACYWHLYLDVDPYNGTIKLNFPDIDPEDLDAMPATCVLDLADGGAVTLEDTGAAMNMSRERIRQLEVAAQRKIARYDRQHGGGLAGLAPEPGLPRIVRHLPVIGRSGSLTHAPTVPRRSA